MVDQVWDMNPATFDSMVSLSVHSDSSTDMSMLQGCTEGLHVSQTRGASGWSVLWDPAWWDLVNRWWKYGVISYLYIAKQRVAMFCFQTCANIIFMVHTENTRLTFRWTLYNCRIVEITENWVLFTRSSYSCWLPIWVLEPPVRA